MTAPVCRRCKIRMRRQSVYANSGPPSLFLNGKWRSQCDPVMVMGWRCPKCDKTKV